jgi:hypothetical protein
VAEAAAFSASELTRALRFLRLFEADQSIAASAPSPHTTRPQSFTPLTVAALPAADDDGGGGAREAAEAELRWLTGRMLAIAARADRRGPWSFTSAATSASPSEPVGDGGGLTPSDELIFNRFGEGFSDTNFAWHKDDAVRKTAPLSFPYVCPEPVLEK